ncbi:hypothetical protein BKA07_003583 [Brevibacterium marinum]|uniref:Uncharacterized protein n=1 Tax=Brevibacterium marinum TaxID=418643 RepID=A0A846S6G1_9MICO|nr:hypothetical protein [Brevibacterium marinum]
MTSVGSDILGAARDVVLSVYEEIAESVRTKVSAIS